MRLDMQLIRFIIFLAAISCSLSYPPVVQGQAARDIQIPCDEAIPGIEARFPGIEGLRLYEVVGGQKRNTFFSHLDLVGGKPLVSEGYVSGVVLISRSPQMSARLGKLRMEKLADGSRLAKSIARHTADADNTFVQGTHYYTYFPRVLGDAVSPDDRFSVSIHDGHSWQELTIYQKGYQCISAESLQPVGASADTRPVFRYAGADLKEFLVNLDDLEERVAVIQSGIETVEAVFGMKLVDFVNILPYKGPNNALTLKGQPQIWFYGETFRSQPISELRGMAQHEALHILVDRLGYTQNKAIRALFAELMGYGMLSLERFSLVTNGTIQGPGLRSAQTDNPFLAFINEKNFIPGMSGGHTHDNLDEFATSFLHTLMFIEHLESNVRRSSVVMPNGSHRELTTHERRNLFQDYSRTLAAFKDASRARAGLATPELRSLFEHCQSIAAVVGGRQESWSAAAVLHGPDPNPPRSISE
jgi:hypothetical protein